MTARFFRKHRHRTRYASLAANGSGVVEAANKVLVNQRMKLAGMRRSVEGGQNVLTLRALVGPFGMATGAANQAPDAA